MTAAKQNAGELQAEQLRDRIAELQCQLDRARQAERELADYRDRWQSLVDHSADVILLIDREGTIEYVNRTDPDSQKLLGTSGFEYLSAEHRDVMRESVASVFETGRPVSREIQEVEQGNWFLVRLSPLWKDGKTDSVIAICADTTSRRVQEEEHREQSTRLRTLLRQLPAIVWTSDTELRITSSTGAGLARLGLKIDELVGTTIYEYLGTEDPTYLPIAAMLSALEGRSECYEAEWQGNFYRNMIEPLRDARGHIEGLLGVALDVSDRKRAEIEMQRARDDLERRVAERTRELRTANRLLREDMAKHEELTSQIRESEERFRFLAEASPVPVVISSLGDGEILSTNRRLGQLLAVAAEELNGRSMREFYVDLNQRETLLTTLARDGSVRDLELPYRRADGRQIWVSASFREITFRGQRRLYAGFIDITTTKQAQESLQSERRLLKRLLDLQDRDRQLIAYEIHDGMVQDMTGAAMFIESAQDALAQDTVAGKNLDNGLKLLRGSIDEARRMINGLRPPILEDSGLVAALEGLVEEMERTAGLEIDWTHDVHFGRIAPALETAVYRIVQEGINNVWKHSQARQAVVQLVQRGDHVAIVVEDKGVGFEPEKLKGKHYGLLGVRERARLLGGTADIESAPGDGARIEVTLPLTDVLLPPDAP